MSIKERKRYVQTLSIATTIEPWKTQFNRLVQVHFDEFMNGIHEVEQFLPWHRWFILELENFLRGIDCSVTVPYWEWSLWAHKPWNNPVWATTLAGLGGDGMKNGPNQTCVDTGPFRYQVWRTRTNACLRRIFNGEMPDAVQVQYCLNIHNFSDFELFLRINLHDNVHCLIGMYIYSWCFI